MERFEQPTAGPQGGGQEARSKSPVVGGSLPSVEMTRFYLGAMVLLKNDTGSLLPQGWRFYYILPLSVIPATKSPGAILNAQSAARRVEGRTPEVMRESSRPA